MRATIEQLHELHEQLKTGRLTGDALQRLLENPDRYEPNLGKFGRIYQTPVNYDLGFDRLLKAADQNGGKDDNITAEHFPIKGKGIREAAFELHEFDETVTGPEAEERILADGYQIEGVPEGLAFAAMNKMAQLRRPIVLLRDRWVVSGGDVHVPYLYWDGGERYFSLYWFTGEFAPLCQFLVSRK